MRAARWGIGSDSHISVSPVEELRWLEYGQRLVTRHRKSRCGAASNSVGETLLHDALASAAPATGHAIGLLRQGACADWLVLDRDAPQFTGATTDDAIDRWMFSGNAPRCAKCMWPADRSCTKAGIANARRSSRGSRRRCIRCLRDAGRLQNEDRLAHAFAAPVRNRDHPRRRLGRRRVRSSEQTLRPPPSATHRCVSRLRRCARRRTARPRARTEATRRPGRTRRLVGQPAQHLSALRYE